MEKGNAESKSVNSSILGNGCSPTMMAEWILSSIRGCQAVTVSRRWRQILSICQNVIRNSNVWYYYDLICKRQNYLNGNEKLERQ